MKTYLGLFLLTLSILSCKKNINLEQNSSLNSAVSRQSKNEAKSWLYSIREITYHVSNLNTRLNQLEILGSDPIALQKSIKITFKGKETLYFVIYQKIKNIWRLSLFSEDFKLQKQLSFRNNMFQVIDCENCVTNGIPPTPPPINWCGTSIGALFCNPSGWGGGANNDCCSLQSLLPPDQPITCPEDCSGSGGGGGGGFDPYLDLSIQLNSILEPGDSFSFDGTLNPAQSLNFSSVLEFQNYLSTNASGQQADLTSPSLIIDQNSKIEHAKFNLTFIGGVDVSAKLEKLSQLWTLVDVTSSEYGVTFAWSWNQSNFSQTYNNNEIIFFIEGYVNYNVIIENLGTVYKQFYKFQVKIDRTTGKITSLVKL